LQHERKNLLVIAERKVDAAGMVQLSALDSGSPTQLVLEPLLLPVCPWPARGRVDLEKLALLAEGPLKNLHDAGFVHCDLRPENIMRCDDKGESSDWVLVDFGAARSSSADDLFEHGTVSFASENVRSAYFSKSPIKIQPKDDLESLVLVAYAMTWLQPDQLASSLYVLKGSLAKLRDFWHQSVCSLRGWKDLLLCARRGDHQAVAASLRGLNQRLDCIDEE
jgi:serine/threonine protein kinase